MSSQIIWYELMTTDVEAAVRFYCAVGGWTVRSFGPGTEAYRQWVAPSGEVMGGLMARPAEADRLRPAWYGYFSVPDVDAAITSALAAGATLCMPATDIPGVGRLAMLFDPQAAPFYIMAPIGEGPSLVFSPERLGHGGWNELHTTDWKAALEFYSSQFGLSASTAVDMGPVGTYQLFHSGGEDLGGMMNSPSFPIPTWIYYFTVDDINAAKARVEAAGGQVLNGPHQVPGGRWMLQGLDPQGAVFGLLTLPEA
jgi:predicted enzyme related to lactoylglutathione lyase